MYSAQDPSMLIDGRLVEAVSGERFDNMNPATESVIGTAPDASVDDMHRAIDSARYAFDETDWSSDRGFRKRCLEQLQAALEASVEKIREELILEVGCPRSLTYGPQLHNPLSGALKVPIRLMDEYHWDEDLGVATDSYSGGQVARRVSREPAGVVGAIVPWNFPVEVTLSKLGPALATGNTVVLKAAPDTPFNATRLAQLVAEETDIPAGVLNIITSSDHLVGEELTLSPKVDLISFTGSTAVGRRIMEKGAATLKRLFLELGGKSATVILDDADVASAAALGAGVCLHAGQGCAIPTRMLLPRSRFDEGVQAIERAFRTVSVGDPQDPETSMGPVISAKQRERVRGYIQAGIEEGATLLLGGVEPPEGLDVGFFVQPTVFVDVDNSMTIAQEEIFGPVLAVIPYDDDDEAVQIANASAYGLFGVVLSGSLDRAKAVGARIRVGGMALNGGVPTGAEVPFGGFKASGVGRQNGVAGFDQYVELKATAWPEH